MKSLPIESTISRWLNIGAVIVTLLVTTPVNIDPVNVPKFVAIVGFGVGLGVLTLVFARNLVFGDSKISVVALFCFIIFSLLSMFFSDSPLVQNFYGTFGRNTGFLTYFGLAGIFLASLTLRNRKSFDSLVKALFVAGTFNVIYCALAISGTDLIGWNNQYGRILGTFGNPNFISAFLGIFITMALGYTLAEGQKIWVRILTLLLCALAFFEILKSNAVQGVVVTFAGVGIVLFFKLRSITKGNLPTFAYIFASVIAGGFAVAGALQMGPLSSLIYKRSVSLRGFYWDAGIQMGLAKPLTGVGFDSYGDWFRKERSIIFLKEQDPNTVTNAAHNVVIDIFASGGFPLLISYLALIVLAFIAIVKVSLRSRSYDGVFVALATGWICYQLQSLISINQIGLAVWGWLLSGAVIAYEIAARNPAVSKSTSDIREVRPKEKSATSGVVFAVGSISAVVGTLIAIPPFAADANWRNAMSTGLVDRVYNSALKWPQDSYRYSAVALQLEQNQLYGASISLARIAVDYNPRSYDAWSLIAGFRNATSEERSIAKSMMIKLDPNNPTIK
jgi:O-antigen ligase